MEKKLKEHWLSKDTIKIYPTCTKKYSFVRNLTELLWSVKAPPQIQNKCDFMLILLSVSHFTTYHHVAFHGYLTINRSIAFHDTPFEGNPYCVHRGHSFPVGNKSLHTFKGGYIVGTLKFSATLKRGSGCPPIGGYSL